MEVILLEDVKALGKKNSVVKVSDGYARNFLFPKKLAVEASATNKNTVDLKKKAEEEKKAKEKEAAVELKEKIQGITLTIPAKGSEQKLFGSVTAQEVADELNSQYGISLEKKKISIPVIKSYGEYEAELRIYPEVTATMKLCIVQAPSV